MKRNSGYPEMYLVRCTIYPNCKLDISSLPSDSIKPNYINDMFSYSIFKTEGMKLISSEQLFLLVYCNRDLSYSFQTNYYSELDQIVLQKDLRKYHSIISQRENNFVVKLNGKNQYKEIFVNFLTYSGDISIKTTGEGFRNRDFIAVNKKYYVFGFNPENKNQNQNEDIKATSISNEIYFYIKGELPSVYSVDYKLIYTNEDKIKMYEESKQNYFLKK